MSKIKKELLRFLIAGSCAVATDLGFYYLLIEFLEKSIAKASSFILGTIVAYLINKFWTFEKKRFSSIELIKFVFLYAFTLFVNVKTNQIILTSLENELLLAFLCATGLSTILNFIGQKWWVFKV